MRSGLVIGERQQSAASQQPLELRARSYTGQRTTSRVVGEDNVGQFNNVVSDYDAFFDHVVRSMAALVWFAQLSVDTPLLQVQPSTRELT
jgi:hypothetical protein